MFRKYMYNVKLIEVKLFVLFSRKYPPCDFVTFQILPWTERVFVLQSMQHLQTHTTLVSTCVSSQQKLALAP